MNLSLLLLTCAPGLAICIYIYWQDKFDKEPKALLVKSFFLGMLSTIPAVILSLIGEAFGFNPVSPVVWWALLSMIIGTGLSEEFSKYIFVRYYAYKKDAFNEPFDGITYSVMVAMGFATLENIFYVAEGGTSVAIARMFTAVPGHDADGVWIGFFLGLQKLHGSKIYGIIGITLTAISHGLYDFFALNAQKNDAYILYWLIVFGLSIYFSFKAIKIHRDASPFKNKII